MTDAPEFEMLIIFMRKIVPAVFPIALLLLTGAPRSAAAEAYLKDRFDGPSLDPHSWYIPTFDHSGDGTYVGRTQFRVTQDSTLPPVSNGNVCVPVDSYSASGQAFQGTEIITRQAFPVGKGLDVIVRAKMATAKYPGIVGGIFLYYLQPGSNTIHDEIDFELLTNLPEQVQTNIYANEPLGVGHAQLIKFHTSTIADYHDYEVKWMPGRVSWLVDGELVRTTTENVPANPMKFYLNTWVPDGAWPQAFSNAIRPVDVKTANATLSALCASSVTIRPLAQ